MTAAGPSGGGASTVLWDLDKTLVGLHARTFRTLMPLLAMRALAGVMTPWQVVRALKEVVPRVRSNTGSTTNHELLVQLLADRTGADPDEVDARLRRLSEVELPKLRRCFFPIPRAVSAVNGLAHRGYRQVLATNPLWPRSSVVWRLSCAGLDPDRFAFIASGETMHRSKSNPVAYYEELLDLVQVSPADCVMIGNDPQNDAGATRLGIPVFLLRTGRLRKVRSDPPAVSRLLTTGDWDDLVAWLDAECRPCSSC